MSIRFEVNKVNHNKLYDEFIEAKIIVDLAERPSSTLGNSVFYFADGTDMDLVRSIVSAHDANYLPAELNELEKLRLEIARSNAEMFETMLVLLGGR